VLAAGGSRRLGRPKQLLPLQGRPLLQHVLDAAAAGGLERLVVVLGAAADAVEAALEPPPGTRIVRNAAWADGQAGSLRVAVAAMPADAGWMAVLLGDQPTVRPEAVRAVAAAALAGHPEVIAQALWPRLAALDGDRGAREIIRAEPALAATIALDLSAPPDVDTEEDYARLVASTATPAG
jgi:molybdenum cofactor cytidylyltransferase